MVSGIYLLGVGLVGLAVFGFTSLRQLLRLALPGSIRCDFAAGPEILTGVKWGPAVQKLAREVQSLGFSPLGLKREWWPLRKPSQALDFASADGKAFATIYCLGPSPRLFFYTPFVGGGVVLTNDHNLHPVEMPDFLRGGITNGTTTALWEYHQQRVASLQADGLQPCSAYDQAARLQATRAFYAHPGARGIVGNLIKIHLVRLALPAGLIAIGAARLALRVH